MNAALSLEADALACIRGGRRLFAGLSFRVEAGQALAVEGPNGAGKTSLLRMIAGFLRPAAGQVRLRVGGHDAVEAEERAHAVGFLSHQDAVKPQLSVFETLTFFAGLYGNRDVADAMARLGLSRLANLPGQYLSAGQKRRVALARLLLSGRPLWLMDEPLAALDAAGKRLAADLIAAHCAAGGIAVVATHEPLGIDGVPLRLGAA